MYLKDDFSIEINIGEDDVWEDYDASWGISGNDLVFNYESGTVLGFNTYNQFL